MCYDLLAVIKVIEMTETVIAAPEGLVKSGVAAFCPAYSLGFMLFQDPYARYVVFQCPGAMVVVMVSDLDVLSMKGHEFRTTHLGLTYDRHVYTLRSSVLCPDALGLQ